MDVTQANGMQTHETSRITMQQLSCRCGPGLGYKTTKRGNKRSYEKEEIIMASRSSNRAAVPEAKGALNRFKYEVANELGVPLTDGYNGNLTSKQNGSVGGYMVKKMIEAQERQMSGTGSSQQF